MTPKGKIPKELLNLKDNLDKIYLLLEDSISTVHELSKSNDKIYDLAEENWYSEIKNELMRSESRIVYSKCTIEDTVRDLLYEYGIVLDKESDLEEIFESLEIEDNGNDNSK